MKTHRFIDHGPSVSLAVFQPSTGKTLEVLVSEIDLPRIQARGGRLSVREDLAPEFSNTRGERLLHRFLLSPPDRPLPRGHRVVCHHKNGDRLDNRRENLELVSTRQNNAFRFAKHGHTGDPGTYFHPNLKVWIASPSIGGERDHLGTFQSELEARAASRARIAEYEGQIQQEIREIYAALGWSVVPETSEAELPAAA